MTMMRSRRFLFAIATLVVMLYFSFILLILNPMHTTRGFAYGNFPYRTIPVVEWCKKLQYRFPPGDVVALASFPGSGNTWLRYLLQQATGILTGSIYMDNGLRLHGFPAENVPDGKVLVVKTHESPPMASNTFKSAVVLIRNPRDAILADFNRQLMGHIGTAPKSAFSKSRSTGQQKKEKGGKKIEWEPYVFDQIHGWEAFYTHWLTEFKGPVYILFYEDLCRTTGRTLRNVLHFLKYNATYSEMACALQQREGIYRRKRKHKDFDPFTDEMYMKLDAARNRVTTLVNDYRALHAKVQLHITTKPEQ